MHRPRALILWSLHCGSSFLPQSSPQTLMGRQLPGEHSERVFSGAPARPDTLRDSPSARTSAPGPLSELSRPAPTAALPRPCRHPAPLSPPAAPPAAFPRSLALQGGRCPFRALPPHSAPIPASDPADPGHPRPPRLCRPGRPLTAMTTVSSPWNLAMYLSPRATSDSLRGLKRHITLMLHSAGSAILGHRRLRGAQLRRRQLPPPHRPRRGSRKPPWPGNPRPSRQEGKGKGSFLAAAAASRSHFLPNMAPAMAAAAAAPAPPRPSVGQTMTSPPAAPAPPPAPPCAQARPRPQAGGGAPRGAAQGRGRGRGGAASGGREL